jgi:hypothetical protein
MCGCSWKSKDGTLHTVVLGFGIISTNRSDNHAAIVTRGQMLGLGVQTGPRQRATLGYESFQEVDVPSGWSGTLSTTAAPGTPLQVISHGPGDEPSLR